MESSSRRARAAGNMPQIAHCLVDGCNADLSQCREYHRRHKVCELHSKTPRVTIGGREQRFCQQCSRFHSLVEFDEGKRSCRKRLDGHNRRRRKPQPELSRTSGMLFSSQQGTRILSFSTPQIYPSAVVSSNWSGVVKAENDVALYSQQSNVNYLDRQNVFHESSSSSSRECDYNKGGSGINQFQFLQSATNRSSSTLRETPSICTQPLLDPDSAPAPGQKNNIFSPGGLNQVISSNRALSLLSSAPAVTVTREIGFSHNMVQPDSISQAQSLVHNLHYSSPGQFHFAPEMEKPSVSETDSHSHSHSHVGNSATLHFPEMFHNGPVESSTAAGGSHQTLTFLWE